MSNIITIGNHKGGVGKTTSTINIGAGLHKLGFKVLLIDLDPQANLTISLGVVDPQSTIYEYLNKESVVEPLNISKGFDIIPSSLNLASAEIELSTETGREYILSEILEPIRSNYDYILIDNPPSLGLLVLNALTASNKVFIPMQAQYLSMQGLSKFVDIINKVQRRLNKKLDIGGVFVTQYDQRKVLNRNVFETIKAHFSSQVFKTKIRENIALAEAPTAGLDIFSYSPKSKGAIDYLGLCKEIKDLN